MKKYSLFICTVLGVVGLHAADIRIDRTQDSLGFTKPIPVSIAGFSGEADSTLRFDLFFMGFEFVSADQARFNIQKNNAAGVGAQITDPLARQVIYNKAFTGGSTPLWTVPEASPPSGTDWRPSSVHAGRRRMSTMSPS